MNLKKLESYLGVNLLGPGPHLIKKEFTAPRSHRGCETLAQTVRDRWRALVNTVMNLWVP